MTNFLNRMAARALGSGAVVRPVVPARFTPGFGLAPNTAPGGASPIVQDLEVEVAAAPAKTTTVTESAQENTLPREWWPSAPALATDSSAQRLAPFHAAQDPTPAVPSFLLNSATASMAAAEPALSAAEFSTPHPGEGADNYVSDRAAVSPADSDGGLMDGDRHAAIEPAIATPFSPARRPIAEPLRPLPALPAHDRGASRRNTERPTESEPPVIRVTIGRIDVRAQFTPASSPAPARHGRPATLTVEEYLRQRREGK